MTFFAISKLFFVYIVVIPLKHFTFLLALNPLKMFRINKEGLSMMRLLSILVTTEHFSGKNGALRWSILVGKRKHNVQRPTTRAAIGICKFI